MERKRKVYAPFSQTSEAGVTQTPVEGYIDVSQMIYPTVSTGVVNEKGQWSGVKSDDDEFFAFTKYLAIANGGEILSPDTGTVNFIDMTGFNDIMIAIKPSASGNVALEAVMGPDTNRFANLNPVNSGSGLRGLAKTRNTNFNDLLFTDSAEALIGNVWNIYVIQAILKGQKNLQFKIVNNMGGNRDFEVAFMRLV